MLIRNSITPVSPTTWPTKGPAQWPFAQEISKVFGSLDEIIAWCKQELSGDWRWQLVEASTDKRPGRYIFYFSNEKDQLAFVMKWT
jgi:hypothetical protein